MEAIQTPQAADGFMKRLLDFVEKASSKVPHPAMIGVGVAEASGLIKALIRKLVAISASWAIAYILVFVGILSSIAEDAGYLVQLGVAPESVLPAYRVADSPMNIITPLNAYFALVVVFVQKYDPKAGVGTMASNTRA